MPCNASRVLRHRIECGYYCQYHTDDGRLADFDVRSELASGRRRPRMKQISFGAILITAILAIILTVPGQDAAGNKYHRRNQALPSTAGSPVPSASPVSSSGDSISQGD